MAAREHVVERTGEPTWEIAHLFPYQGDWTEEEYLALDTNHLIELIDGRLEFLSMPTQSHQLVLLFLYRILWAYVTERNLGIVLAAPMRIRIRPRKYREPDVLFISHEHAHLRGEQFWQGADLVMEIVSPDDPDRDYVQKRADYARLGVAEYWIVDPLRQLITVLALTSQEYTLFGEFTPGMRAASTLLTGFSVAVEEVLAAVQ
ncbi:MAG TPA: Uma2 family endonuclease [Caldilineaceae bacterium]|nr:Uma2 family endonuclease [Caldilineaceae bacterium]